jgi:two-component system, cell cycle response regulator DivK
MQTICLIEDDKITRKLFVLLLERAGYAVQDFGEGAAALDWIRAHTPDVVLSNIVLPGVGGIEILREIREVLNIKTLVVALTSFARRGDREKYLEMGFDGCVAKPIDPQRFAEDFQTILLPTTAA